MWTLYWKKFIAGYWPMVMSAIGCFVVASAAGLAAPIIIKLLIDDALSSPDTKFLHSITTAIVLVYLARGIFSYLYNYLMAKAGNRLVMAMRAEMFVRLQRFDYAYFVNTPGGDIISLFINDLWLIQQAVSIGIPDMVVESINLLAIMGIMFYVNWKLALVTFVTLPFIILAIGYFNEKITHLGNMMEITLAQLTGKVHEFLLSITMIQSYVREDYEYQKFTVAVRSVAAELLRVQRLKAILIPLVEFLAAIGLTTIIWYGGKEVINGELTIGGMFAFLIYIINMPTPVRKISEAVAHMKLGALAWARISQLQEQETQVVDGELDLPQAVGNIRFADVSFSYGDNQETLSHIQLEAQSGDMVVVVGPSGAGKSSFANLLLRFYDPLAGTIYLDGIDIRQLTVKALRQHIGFIPQHPFLFNASIIDNIRYGRPDADMAAVEAAAKLANAHEFIMSLPGGYSYIVGGGGGSQLSGGQRQRIAIARAIITDPTILVLDEPTAALDAEAEKQVMQAIRAVSRGRTTFIITHNLSLVENSDRVVYFAHGRILESGTQAELVVQDGLYAQALRAGHA